jgi:hypothetical protein
MTISFVDSTKLCLRCQICRVGLNLVNSVGITHRNFPMGVHHDVHIVVMGRIDCRLANWIVLRRT